MLHSVETVFVTLSCPNNFSKEQQTDLVDVLSNILPKATEKDNLFWTPVSCKNFSSEINSAPQDEIGFRAQAMCWAQLWLTDVSKSFPSKETTFHIQDDSFIQSRKHQTLTKVRRWTLSHLERPEYNVSFLCNNVKKKKKASNSNDLYLLVHKHVTLCKTTCYFPVNCLNWLRNGIYLHTFFSLAAICLFLFTWLLAMLANFLATVRGRLMGIECLSAPSTGGTISKAVMHSSPALFVTIFIFDHFELELILGSAGSAVAVATGLECVATCTKSKQDLSVVQHEQSKHIIEILLTH